MRGAVIQHVKAHHDHAIHPKEDIKIYPFGGWKDVRRPIPAIFTRPLEGSEAPSFVYVVPSQRDAAYDRLLFVKYYNFGLIPDTSKTLRYCGTISVSESLILRDKVKHILRMSECPLPPEDIQILELISSTDFRILDVSMSIKDLGLLPGSVIVLQPKGSTSNNFDIQTTGLAYPSYGQTYPRPATVDNPVLKALYRQAMRSEVTDVVPSSSRSSSPPFQVAAYKSILALIPYFKSVFTSGMSESKATGVVNLEIPIDVEQVVLMEFIYFVYLRNNGRIANLAHALLLPLLRSADYYGFEELSQAIMDALGKCYCSLMGELALQVLKTIHPLGLDKTQVEDMALTYIACNFSEVGKLAVFREQLEDKICENVVDYVARAT